MKYLYSCILLLFPILLFSQEVENKNQTKYEQMVSQYNGIIKLIDYDLKDIPMKHGGKLICKIREVIIDETTYFYLRLEKPRTMSSLESSAMIDYRELVEINKAIKILLSEEKKDCMLSSDHLENKYVANDLMQIGYYVEKGESHWFLNLGGNQIRIVYLDNIADIHSVFMTAQSRIEELKLH